MPMHALDHSQIYFGRGGLVKGTNLDSLHEMKFDEATLRRAVKDLVRKATEEQTLG